MHGLSFPGTGGECMCCIVERKKKRLAMSLYRYIWSTQCPDGDASVFALEYICVCLFYRAQLCLIEQVGLYTVQN